MDSNAASLYQRFTGLKSRASGIQTWISVGGWSFTDPGPTQQAFSTMTSSQANRKKFIDGAIKFMNTYGFDGVDLDWEYPGADDRGGSPADAANYVSLAKEMKAAFGNKYGLTMTLPTSYWYLQHFDLAGIQPYLDWFNLMSYDLHGTWDKESTFVGPYIAPHTNLTEIDLGLDLMWRSGVKPEKVVLGQGWYGRSFSLSSPSCSTPNGACQFSGPANAGPCSNAAGILDNKEILDIIKAKSLTPVWDKTAGVKWITWDSNQWVSYDDADTFQQKRDFANKRCLGGTMVWAMDQVDQGASNGLGQAAGVTLSQQADASQLAADQQASITCRYGDCGGKCPKGQSEATSSNGQPGSLSTSDRCPKGKYRPLCCDSGTTLGTCVWRGFRGAGLSCMGGCDDGETQVTTNTNSHDKKKGDQTCTGGQQTYCCKGFKPAPTKAELEEKAKDAAKAAAEAAAEQAALDIAAKVFCRVAVPALLLPLEAAEALIPIIGEILDIAEIAATPALIQLCVKGIEKEGKAVFKIFGKKHTLNMDKPTKPPTSRAPPSTHEPPKTTSKESACPRNKRADCKKTVTSYTATSTIYSTTRKICDGERWPQACYHYSSAAGRNARFNPLTCSAFVPARNFMQGGPATKAWGDTHVKEWRVWMRRPQDRCERDEWPPQHFWQGDPGQLIRYNHKEDNGGAGQLWNGFCPENASSDCDPVGQRTIDSPRMRVATVECRKRLTLAVMSMSFDMDGLPLAQAATAGLAQNECYPRDLVDDPTFAILNTDLSVNRANINLWKVPPTPALIGNRQPNFPVRRRDVGILGFGGEMFDVLVEDPARNVSRVPSPKEMEELVEADLRLRERRENKEDEVRELLAGARRELGLDDEDTVSSRTVPAMVEAEATGLPDVEVVVPVVVVDGTGSRKVLTAVAPAVTGL
ncbi:glycosyl hydrolases family 18-domain-containing protein [Rhypophila decipiens]|uniref:chitinase n=1 Tax=Rhypophila decipiens TaxID=261697 RepID=A0AAN6Y3R6_9PEZI|nr:glycosyl hydrolases family 18-domain-containing protein [Rhypophila decipiens]